jgi:hypothetical protein
MKERLETDAQIRADSRKPPSLDPQEYVAVSSLIQSPRGGRNQSRAQPALSMGGQYHKVAQLATAREVKARCRRVVGGTDAPDSDCFYLSASGKLASGSSATRRIARGPALVALLY